MTEGQGIEFGDLKKSVATMLVELVNLRLKVERLLGSLAVISAIFSLLSAGILYALANIGMRAVDNEAQVKTNTRTLDQMVVRFEQQMTSRMSRDEDLDREILKLDARTSELEVKKR